MRLLVHFGDSGSNWIQTTTLKSKLDLHHKHGEEKSNNPNICREDNENEKSCFEYWASSHQADISLGSSPPGRGSVHMLGGLDNDEMDCLEDSFDFIVLVTSSGTTNESSVYGNFWTKKENRETK